MQKNTVLLVIIAALGGFIAGFGLANSINRSQPAIIPAKSESSSAINSAPADKDQDLSPAEIQAKIAEADKEPRNFQFQKDLGLALYKYATMKQDPSLLGEAARILGRARELQPKDADVLIGLGNAQFDLGYARKNNENFLSARELYTQALDVKPGDADVSTDRSLTYLFQEPPDYAKASSELQKVVESNPKHERSLQFLVQALAKQGKKGDAENALSKLKKLDPQNRAISDLEAQLKDPDTGTK